MGLGKSKRKIRIKKPKGSILATASAYLSGNTAVSILPPSTGGIGIKLKIAKIIFKKPAFKKTPEIIL